MSVLRLLSPSKTSRTLPYKPRSEDVTLTLHLPERVFMNPPANDPLWPHGRSEGPRDDQLLNGVLDIEVPPGGRRRCKAVRVGLRTKSRLNMGTGRGWEEDVIFERKVEMLSGSSEGLVLDEGLQRFEFTLILPSTLAPHDWHHNGKVYQEVFAELDGQPGPTSAFSMFGMGASRGRQPRVGSFSSSHRGSGTGSGSGSRAMSASSNPSSRGSSPSGSPRSGSPLSLSPMLVAAASLSITRQEEDSFPLAPSYEQSQADATDGLGPKLKGLEKDDWIMGNHETQRNIMVLHNPNPAGTSSDLDERQSGFAPGIGVWDLKLFSDVFTIGGPIHSRLTLPCPDPKTTIFCWRLVLEQKHTITSPRLDGPPPVSSSRYFTVIEHGTRPAKGVRYPGPATPAMWRGTEAGGKDEGQLKIEGNAVMPRDDRGRPSTLPGTVTPIEVSHKFVYEVFFSVWGEDDTGNPLPQPGPGGLRFLQVTRPIILPSCILVPALLDLPQYARNQADALCLNCMQREQPGEQLCLDCPPSILPHSRHTHAPTSSPGSTSGTLASALRGAAPHGSLASVRKQPISSGTTLDGRPCARCRPTSSKAEPINTGSVRPAPSIPGLVSVKLDLNSWDHCACGANLDDIEERMGKFATEGILTDFSAAAAGRASGSERVKVEA